MEIKTKHRIIGIIAIVALGIIVLPFFINRSQNTTSVKTATQVPLADSSESTPQFFQKQVPAQNIQPAIQPSATITSTANEPHNTAPIVPQQIPSNSNLATEPLKPIVQTTKKAGPVSATEPIKSAPEAENSTTDNPIKIITKPTQIRNTNPTPHKIPRNKNGSVKVMYAHQQKHNLIKKESKKTKLVNLENAWSVQIGSFSQKNNADKLVQQLRKKGFAAYIDKAKTGNLSVERVFVGPEAKRAHAEELVKKLKQAFQLKGVVVKYKV